MPRTDTLTAPQAAAELGLSARTVHRMAEDGRLAPLMKLPGLRGAYVFTRAEVERYAAAVRGGDGRDAEAS